MYATVVQGARGSPLVAVLLHASYNATITIVASAWPEFPMVTLLVLLWCFALGLFALGKLTALCWDGH